MEENNITSACNKKDPQKATEMGTPCSRSLGEGILLYLNLGEKIIFKIIKK